MTPASTALLAHLVAERPWIESLLLGAALRPTDPVFASTIVGWKEVPTDVIIARCFREAETRGRSGRPTAGDDHGCGLYDGDCRILNG